MIHSTDQDVLTGAELGAKLLQSVLEMKAGKVGRLNQVAPNEVAAARLKTGLFVLMPALKTVVAG
jgi:putative transcriptional regulator